MTTVYANSPPPPNHIVEIHRQPEKADPLGHPTYGLDTRMGLWLSGPLAPLYLYSTLKGKGAVWQRLIDSLPDGPFYQPVLDMGCGRGLVLIMLAERKRNIDTYEKAYGIDIFGDDPTRDSLYATYANVAASALIDQTVLNSATLVEQTPYRDGAFGVVTSSLVLHKVDSDDRRFAVKEIMRVCAPGGYILIIDLSPYVGGYARTMRDAGWGDVTTVWGGMRIMFGSMPCSILRARKPCD